MKIIDCDVHQTWADPDVVAKRLPAAFRQPGWIIPPHCLPSPIGVNRADANGERGEAPCSSPQQLISHHLEPFGIDKCILTGAGPLAVGIHPNVHYAAALAHAYNEALAETWLQADDRFFGSIVIAPQDPESAVAEIRRWGNHPRMVQVIMASGARTPFGQKCYWPIYQAACEFNLPVATHPGTEMRGTANGFIAGVPSTYLEWHTNLPQNYMGHLTSLLCEGVFEKFPTLRFVCIEGGLAWIPAVLWRLDKNWKALRSSVPWLKRLPSEYAWDHVRFTTQPIEEPEKNEHMLALLDMVHADRTVMFSSDYPHWDNDSPAHGLLRMPNELAERIFYRNAEELYNFSKAANAADAPLASGN